MKNIFDNKQIYTYKSTLKYYSSIKKLKNIGWTSKYFCYTLILLFIFHYDFSLAQSDDIPEESGVNEFSLFGINADPNFSSRSEIHVGDYIKLDADNFRCNNRPWKRAITSTSNIDIEIHGKTTWTTGFPYKATITYRKYTDYLLSVYTTYTEIVNNYVQNSKINITLPGPGYYEFDYIVENSSSIIVENNQSSGSESRSLSLWYDNIIDESLVNFNANSTSICTGNMICLNSSYIPNIYYYNYCEGATYYKFTNKLIIINWGDGTETTEMIMGELRSTLADIYIVAGPSGEIFQINLYDPLPGELCHTYNTPGTYTVKLILDNYISHVEIPLTITVTDNLTIDVTNDNNCSDVASNLTAIPGDFGPYTYNWSTGSNANTITASTNGIYTVSVSSSTGCTGTANYTLDKI